MRRAIGPIRSVLLAWMLGWVPWACAPSPPDNPERAAEGAADAEPGPNPRPATGSFVARPGFPALVEDDAGRVVSLERAPSRLLSLVPSATDILLELGQVDRLVGRTDFDQDPRVQGLPSVGGGLQPSMERIVTLRPDLVVRFRADSDLATPRQLDEAGIPHLAIRPDGTRDVERIIRLLGRAVGRPDAADSIAQDLATRVAEVERSVAGFERPRVAYLLGGDPPLVAGGGTFLHELIEVAGGDNVFADLGALYAPVNLEEVIRRAPRYLLAREGASIPGALSGLPLVRLPPEVEVPGLGLADSARQMARALHPDGSL